MTVVNLKNIQIPLPLPLTKLSTQNGYEFLVRASHGLLHTLSAVDGL
ncbi:hypothetical protein [Legionella hackeliae]|uniref:Uncharacterized protein n=1 Tax=Legionella hackeliae TaxID=449 RepID=A0A0A8UVN7_LEGHA|nr:hypothetical protein [Legionella hackeliae]CEK10839.1 protein of unknown function [Legionella hackeliae]